MIAVYRTGQYRTGLNRNMLNTLRTIVQEVSAASDLKAALQIIVLRVRAAMHTEVCSVYLFDEETIFIP